jgi:tRNA-Thr(GGU) m(6)t(6)A37 methyltransferase TsaA
MRLRQIGVIRTPYKRISNVPMQASYSQGEGTVIVYSKYARGLKDLGGFSHLILVYWGHDIDEYFLSRKTMDNRRHGIFATRSLARSNPIGISIVKLSNISDNRLNVKGVDMLDNTPLLDIKPYVHELDSRRRTRRGWYDELTFSEIEHMSKKVAGRNLR